MSYYYNVDDNNCSDMELQDAIKDFKTALVYMLRLFVFYNSLFNYSYLYQAG
ncbi:hypothetical protein ABIB62_003581 [Mucilaginibacter sp. UYP25]|uniref:hypothetical protein n=1 Tax=unclassified Mucilaginibacter TaxID=2617802 RepID=UPI00339A6B1D